MSENDAPDISSQFRELGENLKGFLRATWENDESQKLRDEIQNGLSELERVAAETVEEFKSSETGQKVKAEAVDFKQRVQSGEVEEKARTEISKVLSYLNTELGKLNQKVAPSPAEPTEAADAEEAAE